jgi:kinetochore protein Nuf2
MNATRETVEPAMRAAAEDICGEHMEIVPPDTRNLMGFYVSLRKLLVEVKDCFCARTLNFADNS